MFHANYTDSSFVSDHYRVFVDLHYPQLDVRHFEDGSWAIYEMLSAPVIPSQTPWKWIYKGFENIEFTPSLAAKLIRQIDPQFPEFWAREALKSKGIMDEQNTRIEFEQDWAEKMVPMIMKNPGLMERIARYGMRELAPERIALAIAKENPAQARRMGIRVDNENIHTGARTALT